MPNDLAPLVEMYRQTMAQQQQYQNDLLARSDLAQAQQAKQQQDLEKRTEISDQVKDVYNNVGNIVTRDFHTLEAFLTDYNNNLENERAHELGVDAPHASTDLAPALVNAHEERWSFDTPSFSEEERQFAEEDRQLAENDTINS
ncbi:MAG: hypothetical protein IPJ69_14960 [Deltaproteobacteria bacterium]|nr:MAG: hypothetical protein IPJ69_14960 [Deltaproteobacteria bacterium]